MPGTYEIIPALELMKSSCSQTSHWEPLVLGTGELCATLTRNYTHALKQVLEINLFPKFLAKLLDGKAYIFITLIKCPT